MGQAKGEREVAQANNDAIKAKAVALRAEMEHLAGYAGDMADQIKAAEAGADNAAKALAQITEHIEKEKADLIAYNASTKATLAKTKDELTKELAAAKEHNANAAAGKNIGIYHFFPHFSMTDLTFFIQSYL